MGDLSLEGPRYINLRPLPHEFGLRMNIVNTAFSAAWIAGWEIGNVVRMKSEALREGKIPITSRVSVSFQFMGSYLVGVGGKSEVSYADANFGTAKFPLSDVKTPDADRQTPFSAGANYPFSTPGSEKKKTPLGDNDNVDFPGSPYYEDERLFPSAEGEENFSVENQDTSPFVLQTEFFSLLMWLALSEEFGEGESVGGENAEGNTNLEGAENIVESRKDDLLRNFLLFVSGMISESEFRRKLDEIKREVSTGNFVSVYA